MEYSNRSYSSNRSQPPEIEKGADEVSGADKAEINSLFSELGVDATAEEVLDGAETAEVYMHVQLEDDHAENYWRATVDNRDVLAEEIKVGFVIDGEEGPDYRAENVQKPAYDIFNLSSYMETEDAMAEDDLHEVSADAEIQEAASTD
ncbi:hypothetical protein GKQ38_00560 [Candidatus Nanohaloarchaea archaeon]|nr:hypothetical protein GKQ38_00560 [Candidatus Nanohaloarchaea archaeon]